MNHPLRLAIIQTVLLSLFSFVLSADSPVLSESSTLSESDGIPGWTEKIDQARDLGTPETPVVIDIPRGIWTLDAERATEEEIYLSNADPANPRRVGLSIHGLKNAVIDFHGSEILTRGLMITLALEDCENVTLKNFSIDSESPAMIQAEILQNDAGGILLRPAPWVTAAEEDGTVVFSGEGWRSTPTRGMAYDPATKHVILNVDGVGPDFSGATVKDGLVVCPNWKDERLPVGTVVVLRPNTQYLTGVFLYRCRNLKMENVQIHYAPGKGVTAQRCENLHFDGVSTPLRGGLDNSRFFTANADSIHCSCCRGIVTVENGLFESMMDDAVNVHGIYVKTAKRIDDRTLEVVFKQRCAWGFEWAEPGDTVRFITARTMDHFGDRNKVTAIRPLDRPTMKGAKRFELTFRDPLPETIQSDEATALENLTQTAEVVYRNNVIRNNRARGCLFATIKPVLVEGNLFDHVAGSAILFCGDADYWYESGPCENVVIRGNRFVNCMTAFYQYCKAVIDIFPEIPDFESSRRFYNGGREDSFLIEGNEFETFDFPILYARSTDGIIFRKNVIRHNHDFAPIAPDKTAFHFEFVNRVQIDENDFDCGFQPEKDLAIKRSPDGAVRFSDEAPF